MQAESLTATQWLQQFARAAEDRATLDHLVGLINDRILESLPQLVADATLRAELDASTRAHWRGFLAVVAREAFEVQLAPEAFDLARTLARRGFDLTVLLTVYRVGQRGVWSYITDTLEGQVSDAGVRSAVLTMFWSRLSLWLDTAIEAMILTYTDEREQWQRGSLARRVETVQTILAGRPVDVDAAATSLSYPLSHHHTAYVLWAQDDAPDSEVQRLLDTAASTVAAALGSAHPLSIGSGTRALWCWAATSGAPQPLAANALSSMPSAVHVALGTCGRGVRGFTESHTEALAAQSVAGRRSPSPILTRYDDVELACLAAGIGGEEAMNKLIRRELAALATDDETSARLRETARLYLAHANNAHTTGELLNIHPNTVRYRIRGVEGLIGHSVEHRRVYLELALHAVQAFGVPADPPRTGG
ncbi:MAG: helix-turn-helix domain-containing protein [Nocardia sp.]|nr:helix-turn-helix domain-containing protein [Nocardia sp.]